MPTTVFLSHSSQDKPFVRQLADFLEENPADQITVWLDERQITPGSNIVTKISDALASADFILLILSPDSVNSKWVKEEWTDAFWDQTNQQQTKLLGVLYRDCNIPHLLRNKKYFDLRTNHLDGFRQIKTFLLNQQTVAPPRHINQLPQRAPLFIGREDELAELRQRLSQPGALVHISDMAGKGKTSLAKEFAHRHQTDFESVYWLPCDSNSLPAIASDLERQLDLKLGTDLETLIRDLKHRLSQRRCLLIFDNVDGEEPSQLIPNGAASVLITTRRHDLRFLRHYPALDLPLFTEAECLALFKESGANSQFAASRLLGTLETEPQYRQLFNRLGHLPIAVSVAAALIKEDVRYTIESLTKNLPADVTELIEQAIRALPDSPRQLLSAMAACAPEGFSLTLAADIAGFDETQSLDALQQLSSRSLAEELSRPDRRYRLHALVRETAQATPLAEQHANAVLNRFEKWEANWRQCEQDLPDFQLAFNWAIDNQADASKNFPLGDLAYYGFELARRIGRPTESFEICQQMVRLRGAQNEDNKLQSWLGNQALILKAWGRLDEALALHKKQEEICLALGNQNGLQACYGNQALILKDWGRLDEALALHKKQEEICLALGNQDGLSACYGNQALILQDWGRLDEALALHKKQEEICLALGNQDGLSACYGNQALILQDWGRLDEALALHKKEEEICLALGNQDSLQRSYGNQALILKTWGRLDEALALHKKQEEICLALGNQDSLQRSYGNQAVILKAWGRLDEALALHKKQEEICLDLGNQDDLQGNYGNQALILQAWGRLDEALALHKKQEEICLALGNQDGLRLSYAGQALILQAWGRLDEASALHKKEEEICLALGNQDGLQISFGNQAGISLLRGRLEEANVLYKKQEEICLALGNQDGLSACYGNQALILKAWGRLDEALALHKKEEEICLALGNKSSLGYCYWSLGLLERALNHPQAEKEKLSAALTIFEELKMPRERDAVKTELEKSRAASAS